MNSRLVAMGAAGTAGLLAGLVSVVLTTTMGRTETTMTDQDRQFLKVMPSAEQEDADPAPQHLGPVEAAAAVRAFFDDSAPDDATLAAMIPFIGTENVPIQSCGPYTPQGVYDELIQAEPSLERRMKSEIYALLNLRQVLEAGDCTCTGKVAAWEPVPLIFAGYIKRHGEPRAVDAYALRDEAMRLRRAVERLCAGPF